MNEETVTFGEILITAYEGAAVTRQKWHTSKSKVSIYVKVSPSGKPKLYMLRADGTSAPWIPSQKDIFASDWCVLSTSVITPK